MSVYRPGGRAQMALSAAAHPCAQADLIRALGLPRPQRNKACAILNSLRGDGLLMRHDGGYEITGLGARVLAWLREDEAVDVRNGHPTCISWRVA